MKLRTRLFLWVGLIFFAAFAVSLFFEEYSTRENLKEAEESLREQILCLNEEKRQHIERYLHVALSEDQAEITSLLLRISRDPKLGAELFLEPKQLGLVAPAHAAFLFKNARWIDFMQTTKDGNLTSLMIPIDFPMLVAQEVPINEKMSWVILNDDHNMEHPYIGIQLLGKPEKTKDLSILIDELLEIDWGLTVYFDPDAMIDFEKKPITHHHVEPGIDLLAFENSVIKTAEYLKKIKKKYNSKNWAQQAVRDLAKGDIFSRKPQEYGVSCMQDEGEALNTRVVQLLQRADQSIMLAALASLFPSESFGDKIFSPLSPKGIVRFPENIHAGNTVLTREAFFCKKFFDDEKYFSSHPPQKNCPNIASGLAVIAPEHMERVFVGNLLHIQGKEGDGYITVGIDAEEFVEDLVISVNQSAFLVHDGKIISAFCRDGTRVHDPDTKIPFTKEMMKQKSGILTWDGRDYYFLHMIPFKNLDLHFYILQPEKKAFALVRAITEGSREVIKKVSFNMRIIAIVALVGVLLLLHRVARRITKPISRLASVTEDVAKGKLEGISLPSSPGGKNDEISILIESFSQMIKGLQEKEKVQGVLNKVVSPQIAEEITKEQIHLGGEEKKITVLFADIRDFTGMSSDKAPHEVIEMLNKCMTKISHVIDEFEGVIDKYVGDEVMALFGAPLAKEDSALKAVFCAIEMRNELNQWNEERKKEGKQPVEMGFGIHTGIVLVGNMGAENRLNYTVIGNNVNIAARLCSAAKRMEILISKETLEEPHVKESIEVEELPPTELKGFEESFILYRVKGKK